MALTDPVRRMNRPPAARDLMSTLWCTAVGPGNTTEQHIYFCVMLPSVMLMEPWLSRPILRELQ